MHLGLKAMIISKQNISELVQREFWFKSYFHDDDMIGWQYHDKTIRCGNISPASDKEMMSENLAQTLALMISMMMCYDDFMMIFDIYDDIYDDISPASDNEMKSDNLARSLAMMEDELKRAEERVKIAEERVSYSVSGNVRVLRGPTFD